MGNILILAGVLKEKSKSLSTSQNVVQVADYKGFKIRYENDKFVKAHTNVLKSIKDVWKKLMCFTKVPKQNRSALRATSVQFVLGRRHKVIPRSILGIIPASTPNMILGTRRGNIWVIMVRSFLWGNDAGCD